jgi:hypothetical protein
MKFPQINQSQVVLLRAESFTGKVLDADFVCYKNKENWVNYINNNVKSLHKREKALAEANNFTNAEVFTVFEALDEAIQYIDTHRLSKPNVEFIVYDYTEEVIHSYCPHG